MSLDLPILRRWGLPMSAATERFLIMIGTMVLTAAGSYLGFDVKSGEGSEAHAAQDQCCPIARELAAKDCR